MPSTLEELEGQIRAREEVLAGIRRILIEMLDVRRDPDEIDPDAPLFGTGIGLDSIDAIELVVALEQEFGLRLGEDPEDRSRLRTSNSLVDAVLSLRGDHVTG
jgi:acyl carrier protein